MLHVPAAVCGQPRRGPASHQTRRLIVSWQPSVRRELIDEIGLLLAQAGEQLPAAHAGLPAERVDGVASERVLEIAGRNVLVLAAVDPGLRGAALAALL